MSTHTKTAASQVQRAELQPASVNVRVKIAALWVSMLFVYVYVDLFSLFRADVRADLETGTMSGFIVGQSFLFAVTAYIAIPSAMVFLTMVLPAKVARMSNVVLAALYALTVVGGAVGETNYYYILGSVLEIAALLAIIAYARTWPKSVR